jgi:hypothetical protein
MTARELAIVVFDAAPPPYERMTVKHGRLSGVSGAGLEHIAGPRAGPTQYSTPHENFQPSAEGNPELFVPRFQSHGSKLWTH